MFKVWAIPSRNNFRIWRDCDLGDYFYAVSKKEMIEIQAACAILRIPFEIGYPKDKKEII